MSRRLRGAGLLALLAAAAGPADAQTPDAQTPPRPRPAGLAAAAPAAGAPAPGEDGAAATAPDAEPRANAARLKGLDKFSGIARAFDAPYGATVDYERLQVTVRACRRDPDSGGAVAFLTIVDRMTPEAPAFEGWVFSASPALSALDHPRYDVWLLSCSTTSGAAP